METPGRTRRLMTLTERSDQILRVAWDGKFVWVSTARSGIFLLNLNGTKAGHLTAQEPSPNSSNKEPVPRDQFDDGSQLPAYSCSVSRVTQRAVMNRGGGFRPTALWMHALEPGVCIVSGLVDSSKRRWFAKGQFHPDQKSDFEVNVFHTAVPKLLKL